MALCRSDSFLLHYTQRRSVQWIVESNDLLKHSHGRLFQRTNICSTGLDSHGRLFQRTNIRSTGLDSNGQVRMAPYFCAVWHVGTGELRSSRGQFRCDRQANQRCRLLHETYRLFRHESVFCAFAGEIPQNCAKYAQISKWRIIVTLIAWIHSVAKILSQTPHIPTIVVHSHGFQRPTKVYAPSTGNQTPFVTFCIWLTMNVYVWVGIPAEWDDMQSANWEFSL